jgi:hypothetical protein
VLMTGLLIFGLALMLLWPQIIGHPPTHPTLAAKVRFLERYTIYISTLLFTFFATIVCAWVLVRRARALILEDARENMRILMEGTLRDHEKKHESPGS